MTAQPEHERHLAAVPSAEDLARETAAAAADDIRRQTRMVELAQSIAHHEDQVDGHRKAIAEAETELRALHAHKGSTVRAGELQITWKNPSRSFNAKRFQETYPMTSHPHLYATKAVLDTTAIPPKLKDQFMEPGTGDGTIIIK